MAKRPLHKKRARSMRKAFVRRPLPPFVDLIHWLQLHGYADTTGQARKIILDGRVKSESHTLGIHYQKAMRDGQIVNIPVCQPLVPADLRPTLRVTNG